MKQYIIKNTAIMHKGKIFPEGSTINLEDKETQSLSDYLVQTNLELEPDPKPELARPFEEHKLEHKKRSK